MARLTAERRNELVGLRDQLAARIDERRDLRTIAHGIDNGLVDATELDYAMDEGAVKPSSIFGEAATPRAQVAATTRHRMQLSLARLNGDNDGRRLIDVIVGATDATAEATIGAFTGIAQLVASAGNRGPGAAASIESFFDDARSKALRQDPAVVRARLAIGLEAPPTPRSRIEATQRAIVERAIGGGTFATLYEGGVVEQAAGELASMALFEIIVRGLAPAAPPGVTEVAAGLRTGSIGRLAGALFRHEGAIRETGRLGRVISPTLKSAVGLQTAAAIAGATVGVYAAPEDADAIEQFNYAVAGAAVAVTGAAAILGRPYGEAVRLATLGERGAMRRAAVSGATSKLVGGGVKGLERFTLRNLATRASTSTAAALTLSPRTTVGSLVGSGLIGASYATGRALSNGNDVGGAIATGVVEGGAWMGADLALARLGGLARLTAISTRATANTQNWLAALKLPMRGGALAPGLRIAADATVGGLAGGVAGGQLGDEMTGDPTLGRVVGALAGAGALTYAHEAIRTLVPRNVLASMVRGEFGRITDDEARLVAEAVLAVSSRDTLARLRAGGQGDELLEALYPYLIGTPTPRGGDVTALVRTGVRRFTSGVGGTSDDAVAAERATMAVQRGARRDVAEAATTARDAPRALPPARTTATGPGRALPELTDSLAGPEIERIAARRTELTRELTVLEVIAPSTIDEPVVARLLEYGRLRDEYAALLLRAGHATSPKSASTEARNIFGALLERGAPTRLAGRVARRIARTTDDVIAEAVESPAFKASARRLRDAAPGASVPRGTSSSAGFAETGLLARVAGTGGAATAGWYAGPLVAAYFDEDLRDSSTAAFGGALIASTAALAAMAGRSGVRLPTELSALRFVVPRLAEPLARDGRVRPHVRTNKATGSKTRYEGGTVEAALGRRSLARRDFYRLDVPTQLEHVERRVARIAAHANATPAERQARLTTFLRDYAPVAIPADRYDAVQSTVYGALKAAGYSDERATVAWRGFMNRAASPLDERLRHGGTAAPTLDDLARDTARPFTSAAGLDDIRRVAQAASIVSGPEPSIMARFRASARGYQDLFASSETGRSLRALITLERDAAAVSPTASEGATPLTIHRVLGGIRSNESLITDGDALAASGMERAAFLTRGAAHRYRHRVESHQRDVEEWEIVGRRAVHGLTTEQWPLVRLAMEGDLPGTPNARTAAQYRASFAGHNDRVVEVATQLRSKMDDLAFNRLGLPEDARVTDYFAWFISPRSLRELRAIRGPQRGDPILDTPFLHLPRYKVFSAFHDRTGTTPLHDIVDDPLQMFLAYGRAGLHKLHADTLLEEVPSSWLRDLRDAGQPFLAADIARNILDFTGVPSSQHLRLSSLLTQLGSGIDHAFFDHNSYTRTLGDWLGSHADPRRVVNFVRGSIGFSKLLFNFSAAAVNTTQLVVDGGADIPLHSLFIGASQQALPFIRPDASNRNLFDAFKSTPGIFSARMRSELSFDISATPLGGATKGAVAGAIGGLAAPVGDDPSTRRATVAGGALAGAIGGRLAPRQVSYALELARTAGFASFDAVEVFSRGAVGRAASREFTRAERLATTGKVGGFADRARDVLESTTLGALTGGAIGAASNDDSRLTGAAVGAAVGALPGAALGALGETFATRILRDTNALRPFARDEVASWYTRQSIAQTQFSYNRNWRGYLLRTPAGELMSTLQTYTIGQAEFMGARAGSFYRSLTRDVATGARRAPADVAGTLDTRIIRHAALLTATTSVLTALTVNNDPTLDRSYWLSRVGLGLFTFLDYDVRAEKWKIADLDRIVGGAFIDTLHRVGNTALHLTRASFDPQARATWDRSLDDLANGVVSMMDDVAKAPDAIGDQLEAYGAEGLAELVRDRRDAAMRLSRPVTTTTRGEPVPRSRSGRGAVVDSGFGSMGGGEFGGGFE